jgi:hypothetical protein
MKELRALLIDCRIELRRLVRDFHKTPLCERLDAATQALANQATAARLAPEATPDAASEPGPGRSETTNQVALAWQLAARELKFSQPALYEQMSRKVMARLGDKSLQDPVDELHAAQGASEGLREQLADLEKHRAALEAERDAVLGALATAVPQLADGGDRLGVALARVDCLLRQATQVASTITVATVAEEESRIPSAETIAAIASGARQFTQAQREWCVGEAMVLSGFEFTPMELIEQGDAQIARIIATARGGQ